MRTVLQWQAYATAGAVLLGGLWQGYHGAISALLGGVINIAAGAVFGWIATRSSRRTAGDALRALLRAEAGKVLLIVVQLWLVLAIYRQVALAAFFATFFLTLVLSSMAFFVRER